MGRERIDLADISSFYKTEKKKKSRTRSKPEPASQTNTVEKTERKEERSEKVAMEDRLDDRAMEAVFKRSSKQQHPSTVNVPPLRKLNESATVVCFQDPLANVSSNMEDTSERRRFLSSSVKEIGSTPSSSQKPSQQKNDMNDEEREQLKLDMELKSILPSILTESSTKMKRVSGLLTSEIERYAASQLQGKDRIRYMRHKLASLTPKNATKVPTKYNRHRVPMDMYKAMMEKSKERATKAKEELREMGMPTTNAPEVVFSSVSHPLKAVYERQQEKKRRTEAREKMERLRGVSRAGTDAGIGRFDRGTLHLRSWEMRGVKKTK